MTERLDSAQADFLAELLRSESAVVARAAAKQLVQANPQIARRWGAVGGRAVVVWSESLQARVHDLAAAIGAMRPELFRTQMSWSKVAFLSRKVPLEDLSASLGALEIAVLDVTPPEDRCVVGEYFAAGRAALSSGPETVQTEVVGGTAMGALVHKYLLAVLDGDRRQACKVLSDAAKVDGVNVPTLYTEVLAPAMREMGRMWHIGDVSIAEEHFATATTLMAMSQLLQHMKFEPSNGRTVVAASVMGNTHEIGARMVADYFESRGWRTIYLGPNVPSEDLALSAEDYNADVVLLSAMLPSHLYSLKETAAAIRSTVADRRVTIIAGGAALMGSEALAIEHGADMLAMSPREAEQLACRTLGIPPVSGLSR